MARDPLAWIVLAVVAACAVLRAPDGWPSSVLGVLGALAFLVVFYGFTWLILYAVCFHGRTRWRASRRHGASIGRSLVSAVFGRD